MVGRHTLRISGFLGKLVWRFNIKKKVGEERMTSFWEDPEVEGAY